MKSKEYVAHGTASSSDAESIKEEGFKAQEGRATVSADLIYAFEWAKNKERRTDSKSESEVDDDEMGRIIIMKNPENIDVGYATHTDILVDEVEKEITGYPAKYESGRKQFAIYGEDARAENVENGTEDVEGQTDIKRKREKIENSKQELKNIKDELDTVLEQNGIDSSEIKSKEDLISAIASFDIEKKIDTLKKVEDIQIRINQKIKESEQEVSLPQESVVMSIVPDQELGEKLEDLSRQIKSLDRIDLVKFSDDISGIISNNKENFVSSGLDIKEVVRYLVESTIEAEVVSLVRALSMNVKRANGFSVYNRGRDEVVEKEVDKEKLKEVLIKLQEKVNSEDFDIGLTNLNRYIRSSVNILVKKVS